MTPSASAFSSTVEFLHRTSHTHCQASFGFQAPPLTRRSTVSTRRDPCPHHTPAPAPESPLSNADPAIDAAPTSPPATRRPCSRVSRSPRFVLFATYSGLIAILLPNQVAAIDDANKVSNLAIVSTGLFVFTLFAQPIVGAFSDRTRSKPRPPRHLDDHRRRRRRDLPRRPRIAHLDPLDHDASG